MSRYNVDRGAAIQADRKHETWFIKDPNDPRKLVAYTSELKSMQFERDHDIILLKHVEQDIRKFFNVSNSTAVGFLNIRFLAVFWWPSDSQLAWERPNAQPLSPSLTTRMACLFWVFVAGWCSCSQRCCHPSGRQGNAAILPKWPNTADRETCLTQRTVHRILGPMTWISTQVVLWASLFSSQPVTFCFSCPFQEVQWRQTCPVKPSILRIGATRPEVSSLKALNVLSFRVEFTQRSSNGKLQPHGCCEVCDQFWGSISAKGWTKIKLKAVKFKYSLSLSLYIYITSILHTSTHYICKEQIN